MAPKGKLGCSAASSRANYADGALGSMCRKTKLCSFFQQGSCPKGRDCKFAHGEQELQVAPDLAKTKMCPKLIKWGQCDKGAACNHAHSPDELRSVTQASTDPFFGALATKWQSQTSQSRSRSISDISTEDTDRSVSEVSSPTCSRAPSVSESSNESKVDSHSLALDGLAAQEVSSPMCSKAPSVCESSNESNVDSHSLALDGLAAQEEVLVVEGSFAPFSDTLTDGTKLLFAPTGMALAIRNTFFDVDDAGSQRPSAARRSQSAGARLA